MHLWNNHELVEAQLHELLKTKQATTSRKGLKIVAAQVNEEPFKLRVGDCGSTLDGHT